MPRTARRSPRRTATTSRSGNLRPEKVVRIIPFPASEKVGSGFNAVVSAAWSICRTATWAFVASAGKQQEESGRIFVFDAASGKLQRTLDRREVKDFCFCGDNRTLAIAECDASETSLLTLWDITSGNKINESSPLKTDDGYLQSVAFLPRIEAKLVTCENLRNIRLWNLPGLEMELLPKKTETSPDRIVASEDGRFFLPRRQLIISTSASRRDGEIFTRVDYLHRPSSAAFSPNGSWLEHATFQCSGTGIPQAPK